MKRKVRIILLAGAIGFIGLSTSGLFTTTSQDGLISTAEARVGRPLTPVSVAGVTRRTVRRCAVGVYNC